MAWRGKKRTRICGRIDCCLAILVKKSFSLPSCNFWMIEQRFIFVPIWVSWTFGHITTFAHLICFADLRGFCDQDYWHPPDGSKSLASYARASDTSVANGWCKPPTRCEMAPCRDGYFYSQICFLSLSAFSPDVLISILCFFLHMSSPFVCAAKHWSRRQKFWTMLVTCFGQAVRLQNCGDYALVPFAAALGTTFMGCHVYQYIKLWK